MALWLNTVTLIGRVVRDIEANPTYSGKSVSSFVIYNSGVDLLQQGCLLKFHLIAWLGNGKRQLNCCRVRTERQANS